VTAHSADRVLVSHCWRSSPSTGSCLATATDQDDVTRKAPSLSDANVYGYDSAGNPALTDADGYYPFSDSELQD
jgi:hypothetical protein